MPCMILFIGNVQNGKIQRERERLAVAKLKGESRIESEYYGVQGFGFFFFFVGMMKIFCSEIMQMVVKSCEYINTKNQ